MCAITRLRIAHQLHRAADVHVARALALADHQLAHVHREALRNFVRQALDFDGAGDDFEQSALHLHAGRFALGMHRDGDADALGQVDALEIGVQQQALDRIHLPVHHHDRGVFAAGDRQGENGIQPGRGTDDLAEFLRVDCDADRVLVSAVHHRRDVPRGARTARFILAARSTHFGGYRNIFSQFLSPVSGLRSPIRRDRPPWRSLTWVRIPAKSYYTNKVLTEVSS